MIGHGPGGDATLAPARFRIAALERERGFRLGGDLDLFTVEAVRAALGEELHGTLVLDLAGVEFMDDSGLGLLVWLASRLGRRGGLLELRNPGGNVVRALEITGLAALPGLRIEHS
jgi:anti-anti-sigma factor